MKNIEQKYILKDRKNTEKVYIWNEDQAREKTDRSRRQIKRGHLQKKYIYGDKYREVI